jgi:putative ABC transport system permease protein
MISELRYTVRRLLADRSFTLTAVLTLCLGIGASTSLFSVINALLLRPLPFEESERLVVPVLTRPERNVDRGLISYTDYTDWLENDVFSSASLYRSRVYDVGAGIEPEQIEGANVAENYFETLGVRPLLGRTFLKEEEQPGGYFAAIMSYRLWQRHFGGDPEIVGKMIVVNGRHDIMVCGVLPKGCEWPAQFDMWIPLAYGSSLPEPALRRDNFVWGGIARLKPGMSLPQTQLTVEAISRRVELEYPDKRTGWRARILSLSEWIVGPQLRRALTILLATVVLVLLLACANVASLLLARAQRREHEMAVRAALGASRSRLIRQVFGETLLLTAIGGLLSLLLGIWFTKILFDLLANENPSENKPVFDLRVLTVLFLVCLLSAVFSGLFPAIRESNIDPSDALKRGGRGAGGGTRRRRMQAFIVAFEIAVSLILLIGAGLMAKSFNRLNEANPGFELENLLNLRLVFPRSRYPDDSRVAQSCERLRESMIAVPGVTSCSASSSLPLGGGGYYLSRVFLVEGEPEPPAGRDHPGHWSVVTPDYFRTLGIPLLEGRDFRSSDTAASNRVIIINQSMARELFPSDEPIGKRIRSWRDENKLREVVGIVGDIRYLGMADEGRCLAYAPHLQDPWIQVIFTLRTTADPNLLAAAIREEIHRFDKELALGQVETMEDVMRRSTARTRASTLLISIFALVAMLLTAVGVSGVVSHSVSQRTHELGIRIALGAQKKAVLLSVISRALPPIALGLSVGIAGSLLLTRFLGSMVFKVSTLDLVTFASAPVMILFVAALGVYLPARKAADVDPIISLKQE